MESLNFSEEIFEKMRKQDKNSIIVSGDEPVSIVHINTIIKKISDQNNVENINIDIDTSTNTSQLKEKLSNDSLFSSNSVYKINILSNKINVEIKSLLISLVETYGEDQFYIFFFKQNLKELRKITWIKPLIEKSKIIEAAEPTQNIIKESIKQRAKFHKLNLTNDAINIFCELTERNFLLVENEIIKLSLIFGNAEINHKTLLNHLSNGSKYDVFDLINASMTGNRKMVLKTTKCLHDNGVQPIAVNGLFAWIFKAIIRLKSSNIVSPSYDDFIKLRIFGTTQMIIKKSLSSLSQRQIEMILMRIKDIDLICKGINYGDAWLELNRLSFGLSRLLNKSRI